MIDRQDSPHANPMYVADLGSHSIKLYRRLGDGVKMQKTHAWQVLKWPANGAYHHKVGIYLDELMSGLREGDGVVAVATAAFRNRMDLSTAARLACAERGIPLEILEHDSEAELLAKTINADPNLEGLIGVNVGCGSIQLAIGEQRHLLSVGIMDLTKRFLLDGLPSERLVADCTDWVVSQMPPWSGPFAYLGDELTYLMSFGVPVEEGWCHVSDFKHFANKLNSLPMDELMKRSPFDPGWMSGAIGSNCIVQALLRSFGTERFRPVNANIGHAVFI